VAQETKSPFFYQVRSHIRSKWIWDTLFAFCGFRNGRHFLRVSCNSHHSNVYSGYNWRHTVLI